MFTRILAVITKFIGDWPWTSQWYCWPAQCCSTRCNRTNVTRSGAGRPHRAQTAATAQMSEL
eukprot:5755018-Pyramimonas_sp.AAC.1